MPISQENRRLYHPQWKEISQWVRGLGKCEFCGVANHSITTRTGKPVKIVLTVAHIDHDPANNTRENLRALCQQCHNRHDAPHRAKTRKMKKGGSNV